MLAPAIDAIAEISRWWSPRCQSTSNFFLSAKPAYATLRAWRLKVDQW